MNRGVIPAAAVKNGGIPMLISWQSNSDYRNFLHDYRMNKKDDTERNYFNLRFRPIVKVMTRLDIDAAMEYIRPLYPRFGRPAQGQAQILRSFILMSRIDVLSITAMVDKLRSDPDIAALAGFSPSDTPAVASFYEFMIRLWGQNRSEMHLGINDVLPCDRNANALDEVFQTKNSKGIGSDGKLPDSNPSITEECERIITSGKAFPNTFGVVYQGLLRILGIKSSEEAGLLAAVNTISGDGTCFHVHASPHGHHRCDCHKCGIHNCTCPRHFSDADATWGYDSDLEKNYFGHTIYTLTAYNPDHHVDLPMHIRILSARRHDSASGLICLHEFFSSNPDYGIQNVCLDSAHDNMPTYRLCVNTWHVNPLIDLNGRGKKKSIKDTITYDNDGVPICHCGKRMVYQGMDYKNNRLKYRCPLAAAGESTSTCPCIANCSPSKYGRCVYVKSSSDLRLFPPIPRESELFKNTYKQRTACERVNNRLLNDYHLATYKGRTAMRIFFFTTISAINIHLDAQLKVLKDSDFPDVDRVEHAS